MPAVRAAVLTQSADTGRRGCSLAVGSFKSRQEEHVVPAARPRRNESGWCPQWCSSRVRTLGGRHWSARVPPCCLLLVRFKKDFIFWIRKENRQCRKKKRNEYRKRWGKAVVVGCGVCGGRARGRRGRGGDVVVVVLGAAQVLHVQRRGFGGSTFPSTLSTGGRVSWTRTWRSALAALMLLSAAVCRT